MIAHVELRNEESPDVAVFTHKRNVDTIVVALDSYLLSVQERFMLVCVRCTVLYTCSISEIIFLSFFVICSVMECSYK
jgi:ERCC4-related helicase